MNSNESTSGPAPAELKSVNWRRPFGDVMVWAASGLAVLILAFLVLSLLLPDSLAAGGRLLLAASLAAVAVLAYVLRSYRRTLTRLQQGIRAAEDGVLKPVAGAMPRDGFLRQLMGDYNRTITTLGAMFAEVEECQNRVLGERNRMNVIIQSLPGALLGVNDELQVNAVNKLTEEFFGLSDDNLLGRNLFDLIAVNETDREILRDAFLYKREVSNQELDLTARGRMRTFSLNLSFLSEEDFDLGAVLTLQDITDYKRLQESVNSREKLVAMGQLAGGVAHELNTPLGNILGHAQMLRSGTADPQKAERYLQVICDETRRCSRIIDELLSYARQDKCDDEYCDLNNLAHEVVDSLLTCSMKRYKIQVSMELDPRSPTIAVGSGHVDIVLVNLLLNSMQALRDVPEPRIVIRTRLDPGADAAIVSVEDNGPGVPEPIRSRIFDPFFTTKDVGEGTGLGLSITQAILSKHGGNVKYDDSYTQGARFIVKLPAARVSTAGAA